MLILWAKSEKMNGTLIEDGYVINMGKRCLYCKACEVMKLGEGKSNLTENKFGTIMCTDAFECRANLEAENTAIEMSISDNNTTFRDRYGNEIIFDNPKDKQPQFTDDFKGYFGDNGDDGEGDDYYEI